MINDAGGECIARALSLNKSLTYLNLKKNNLREITGLVLVEYMEKNKTLTHFNLAKN